MSRLWEGLWERIMLECWKNGKEGIEGKEGIKGIEGVKGIKGIEGIEGRVGLLTTVKYAPTLMKYFRASNFTPTRSSFPAGQARQASYFTWQAFNFLLSTLLSVSFIFRVNQILYVIFILILLFLIINRRK